MLEKFYGSGVKAVSIDEQSNAGFIYYPNGKAAVVISTASAYQNSFYAYDKDKKGSLLLALNEMAVGFGSGSQRKSISSEVPKVSVVFTKKGGILTDAYGATALDWVWKKRAPHDVALTDFVTVKLSEHISIAFKSQEEISLKYEYENIKHTVDMGVKVLRKKPDYLLSAKRLPGGHLLPLIDHQTLRQRTIDFNASMRAQRNKLNPKSENLSDMVSGVVGNLEDTFDDLSQTMHAKPSLGLEWRETSLDTTKEEVPQIPLCGTETGDHRGLGSTIYIEENAMEGFDPSKTLPKDLMGKNGTWKGSLEIRAALEKANPIMKRTFVLKSASGRYSNMIIVDPSAVTPQNPTGMLRTRGKDLGSLSWRDIKSMFATAPAAIIPGSPLIVGLIMRDGQPDCCIAKGITELVNLEMNGDSGDRSSSSSSSSSRAPSREQGGTRKGPVEFVKIDVSADSSILVELGIKSMPTFVMINSGRLCYAGPIGGRQIHLRSKANTQVLLIEPTFKDQISMEKTLKKNNCDSFLCLDVFQALERLRLISQSASNGGNEMIFDLVFISEDVSEGDFDALYRKFAGLVKAKRTVIAGLVSVLGEDGKRNLNAVPWTDYTSFEVDKVMTGPISQIASVVIQKPIKVSAIRKLLTLRTVPTEDVNFGLTPDTLKMKIDAVQDSLASGSASSFRSGSQPNVGIKLSAEDVKFAGRSLIKPPVF